MTELVPIEDTAGSFITYRDGFGIDDDRPWETPIRVFLAKLDDANVLVDAGVGPPGGGSFMPDRQGRLPAGLEEHGLGVEDIDLVVLTHLHADHVGWAIVNEEPFFPRARYVAHADDLDYFARAESEELDIRDRLIALRDTGRVEAISSDGEVHPGVQVRHLPGHTPGHIGVEIDGVLIFGDAVVHELQLADPELAFAAEADPAAAGAMRRALLPELADAGTVVASTHLPTPLGRIGRRGDAFAWLPVD